MEVQRKDVVRGGDDRERTFLFECEKQRISQESKSR